MTHRPRRATTVIAAGVLAAPLALAGAVPASAEPRDRAGSASARLQRAVTTEGVMEHLRAFQTIADANGGQRAAGTPGYDASAEYVAGKLRRAGYRVELQAFEFPYFEELSPAVLARTLPTAATYVLEEQYATMTFSGAGVVTAPVVPVDVTIPPSPTPGSTSGCEASDFATFPAGSIALLQRGTCTFGVKVANAVAAGAVAAVIFNEGQEGRTEAVAGTLGAPVGIPVIGASYAVGVELAATSATVRVAVDTLSEVRTTNNVIAQTRGGNTGNVVMAGAHLDSVTEGPGINDNGSGSAAILETALQMARTKPANQVRFAFWSAEELGLLGSADYVEGLTPEQLADIALYLNFDMVGSPNFIRGVYDGNGTTPVEGVTVPEGSAAIENLFNAHFTEQGLDFQDTEFSGRSDYQAFIDSGIASGGLFTGAEGLKTPAEVALYGGAAGVAYDPCYHAECDDLVDDADDPSVYAQLSDLVGNVNTVALDTNSDAIAHAVATFARDTSAVNGVVTAPRVRGGADRGDRGDRGGRTPGHWHDAAR